MWKASHDESFKERAIQVITKAFLNAQIVIVNLGPQLLVIAY